MPYTYEDKRSFWNLHFVSFALHLISTVFAFILTPPQEKMRRDVYVESTLYWKDENNVPYTNYTRVPVIEGFNAIACIGVNEALTTLSHLIALFMLSCCAKTDKKAVYRGRSRPEEYTRRWIEYAVTAGLLEVGILAGQGELNIIILLGVFIGNASMQAIGYYNDDTPEYKWSWVPNLAGFGIMFSIIQIFIFRSSNSGNNGEYELKSLTYGYLAIIFSIFYLSFGIHQMLYLNIKSYARAIDADKIYIVLGFTSKIVLSWTYIAISRQVWDELGSAFDKKVPWEDTKYSISTWDTVKYGIALSSLAVIIVSYIIEYCQGRPQVYPNESVENDDGAPLLQEKNRKIRRRQVYLNF